MGKKNDDNQRGKGGEFRKPVDITRRKDTRGSIHTEEETTSAKGKPGGMSSWLPTIIAVVAALVASAVMVFILNPASAEIKTLTSQIPDLESTENRMVNLEESVTQSNQRIDNLISSQANYVSQGSLAGLASAQSVTDLTGQLNTQVAELTTRMVALEVEAEEEAEAQAVIEDTVRWRFTDASFDFTVAENHDLVDIDVSSGTIDEEDYYSVKVTLEYLGKVEETLDETLDIGNHFSLVLEPRGDALLSESYTGLYSESSPYTDWDADFRYRERDGVTTTRRVVFESYDPYDIVLTEGDPFRINLELELAYAR